MSIQVTAAFGTAVAALIIAWLSKSAPSAGADQSNLLTSGYVARLITALVFLYAFVQSLILANYVYQTFQVGLIEHVCDPLTREIWQFIDSYTLKQSDREFSSSRQQGACLRGGWLVATSSQPLIIYCSAGLGWLSFFFSSFVWPSRISLWFLPFFIAPSCSIWLLWLIHRHIRKLAQYEHWVTHRDADKAKVEEHQPQTPLNP